jgi:outer membrane immunogenic protein
MRFDKTVLLTTFIALSAALSAGTLSGQGTHGTDTSQMPLLETSVGYTFLHANAPPGQCGCFSANGGFGSVVFNLPRGLGIVADLNAVHADSISGTTQSITVFNYLFGPRYSFQSVSRRFVPYAQVLGGGSRETSSYSAVQNAKGAAFSIGGGLATTLNRHFAWTIFEADWIHSYLPNAQNDLQNDLRVSSAISFRFGSR